MSLNRLSFSNNILQKQGFEKRIDFPTEEINAP